MLRERVVRGILVGLGIVGFTAPYDRLSASVSSAASRALPASPPSARSRRADGARLVYSPADPLSAQNPAYAPDGRTLVFTMFHRRYNSGEAGVYLVPRSGGSATKLFDVRGHQTVNLPGSCWNAATNRIAFASDLVNTDEVWTIAPDGSGMQRVTHTNPNLHAIEPSFSPDGQWIAFEVDTNASGPNMYGSIWKIRADGTGLAKLRGGPGSGRDDRQPNWSPAGDRIVFQERLAGNNLNRWNLFTMDSSGGRIVAVTSTQGSNTDASWSPDGRWIDYSSDYGGLVNANVFAVPANGGQPVRITTDSRHEDGASSWSPDGKHITFESHFNNGDPADVYEIAVPTLP